jgi:ribonuclease BN (tRNA processing enzyme)
MPVAHAPESEPHGLRLDGSVHKLAYSGDTEWTDTLIELCEGTDLFVCECSTLHPKGRHHLSYEVLQTKLPLLRTRRLLLTHMEEDMLAALPLAGVEAAFDGMELQI